jgi:hypothetical protein
MYGYPEQFIPPSEIGGPTGGPPEAPAAPVPASTRAKEATA